MEGQWYRETKTFQVDLNKNDWRDLDWLVITGGHSFTYNNFVRYLYFDNVSLFRQCDVDSACFPATGQICPRVAVQSPPATPFRVYDIANANSLDLRIATGGGVVVIDTVFTNPNGLHDFYWPGEILGNNVASGTYVYEITLRNKCGGVKQSDGFTVLNGVYDTVAAWVDTTATWSETPIPCCLHTLTLADLEIVGDVSYIVKDTIWVRDGVTAADSSHVLIQAGQVVELDSVEFDGTVSTVEILEAPCQGCRLAPPTAGGTAPDPTMIGTHGVITASGPRPEPQLSQMAGPPPVHPTHFPDPEPSSDYEIGVWAYPNPFANSVTVEIELPRPGSVSLLVYDSGMREVARIVQGRNLPAGMHTYRADLSDHPVGLYLVQLVAEGQTYTEKIVKQ